jgi:putative membrane protein insertion efficiency factor
MSDTSMSNPPQAHLPGFAQRALSACIRSYQVLLSPVFGTQCRFYPTCSHFALDAIARHGAGKGLLLTVGRIARCNPLCEGGHDPVPERFSLVK